jgi:hypothetical protein
MARSRKFDFEACPFFGHKLNEATEARFFQRLRQANTIELRLLAAGVVGYLEGVGAARCSAAGPRRGEVPQLRGGGGESSPRRQKSTARLRAIAIGVLLPPDEERESKGGLLFEAVKK